jgi:hypothetical protein
MSAATEMSARRARNAVAIGDMPMATQGIDIIHGDEVAKNVAADFRTGAPWISAADFARVTGWMLKPEGLCRADVCVPVPPGRRDEIVASDGRINLPAGAELVGRPAAGDETHRAWSIGASAAERKRALTSLEAPDFRLPDLAGRIHSLSEYRGRKVLLVSWASW